MSGDADLLVKVADLQKHMNGITFNADQQTAVEGILRGLQAQVERYLRRPITVRQFTRTAQVDLGTGLFWTHTPLRSIVSVTPVIDGSIPLESSSYALGADGLSVYSYWGNDLTVVYTAGLDATQDDLADLILLIKDAAARGATHRHDKTMSVRGITARVEPGSETVPPNEIRLSKDELDTITWLRRVSVY